MTSRYQTRFLDRVILKGQRQPISIDQVLDPETKGAFQFCFDTPKKRFLQNRGAPETQLVRQLKLQTQRDFIPLLSLRGEGKIKQQPNLSLIEPDKESKNHS